MPTRQRITVITAVSPDRSHYLYDTACSVLSQRLPQDWELEWMLQIDGPGAIPNLPDDPRVIISRNPTQLGVAISRNYAAARATGVVYRNLDGDDILTPGALYRDISLLRTHTEAGFTISEALDLLPDGTTKAFTTSRLPGGPIPLGYVVDLWREQPILDVHATTLAIRADLFWASGGYAALQISEDVALIAHANEYQPGVFGFAPSLLYRKWDQQVTSHPKPNSWASVREHLTTSLINRRSLRPN